MKEGLRIIGLVSAAPGWRRLIVRDPGRSKRVLARVEELTYVVPIAAFALVEYIEDDERHQDVVPVRPDDFPPYLSVEDERTSGKFALDLLGPGENLGDDAEQDEYRRKQALEMLERSDEERAR